MPNNVLLHSSPTFLTLLGLFYILFSFTPLQAVELKQLESFQKLPLVQQEVLLQEEALLRAEIARKSDSPTETLDKETPPLAQNTAQNIETVQPPLADIKDERDTRLERIKSLDDRGATDPLKGIASQNQRIKNIELPRFGADIFAGQATTFAPVNDIPIPTDYILGPGDQIKIQLYGGKNELYKLIIDRNGAIAFPGLGPINIAGLSFSEAAIELKKHVETLGIGINASITLGDLRSFRIFVMGESNLPGSYLVSGMATITHAIYVSGGLSEIASFRNIQLRRNGRLIKTLDLYDLLIHGNTQHDVRLQPGDTVFIPVKNKTAAINGEVRRPAIYELKNEKTFADLISLAGGVKPDAYLPKAKITRVTHEGFAHIKEINLAQQKEINQPLQNGDLLTVSGISNDLDGVITLSGEVQRPGLYTWHEGITLSDVLKNEQDFKRHADLDFLVILRQTQNGADYEVKTVSWQAQKHQSVALNARDRIFVFSKLTPEERQDTLKQVTDYLHTQATLNKAPQTSEIVGLIKFPGEYPLAEGTHLNQLIHAAGGIQPETDTDYILIRRQDNASGRIEFIQTTLEQANELVIQPRDKIHFFALEYDERAQRLETDTDRLKRQAEVNRPAPLVSVSGLVKSPGLYPLTPEAKITDLLKASGGLKFQALQTNADLIRFTIIDGDKHIAEARLINLARALENDAEHNLTLKPGDELIIKQVTDWQEATRRVSVEGEVRYPGTYIIRPGETLQSVLDRAGGFTEWANPKNAVFIREALKKQEEQEKRILADELEKNLMLALKSDSTLHEWDNSGSLVSMARSIVKRIKDTPSIGRLVIGLDPQNKSRYSATLNMELRHNDRLFVPKRTNEIVVMGEVFRPTSVIYEKNKSVDQYLNLSGGITKRADKDSIFVVHGDGTVERYGSSGWFDEGRSITLEPGATIVVPINADQINSLVIWSNVSSILANFAVAGATLKTLGVVR